MKFLLTILVCMMMIGSSLVCNAEEPTVKLGTLYNRTGGMSSIDLPACR